MKKLPKITINKIGILIALTLVLLIVGTATAQELQRTFTVINPAIEVKLNPGEYKQGTTKVINESNTPLTFQLEVQDYIVGDELGTPQILQPNELSEKYSARSWIGISPTTFTLKPKEQQVISYYIQTPPDSSAGGHYAAIVYKPVVATNTNDTGGTVNAQIGSLFYITINGDIKEKAEVTKFTTPFLQEFGPIKIDTQIKNLGGLHIRPKGDIKVTGLFVNESQKLSEQNIFPEVTRSFENTFGKKFLMLGQYKAEFIGSYGLENNLPLTSVYYFWVIPWKLLILIALVAIVLILGSMYLKRKKKGNTKKDEEVKKETANPENSPTQAPTVENK